MSFLFNVSQYLSNEKKRNEKVHRPFLLALNILEETNISFDSSSKYVIIKEKRRNLLQILEIENELNI